MLDDLLVRRQRARAPLGEQGSVSVDQVFLEVPRDRPGDGFVGMTGEVLVKRRLIVTFDGNLREQVEGGLFRYPAKGLDLRVAARFLLSEVVGGER